MERSRRGATKLARQSSSRAETAVPAASRLTLRARKNRRRPSSLWSRVPRPRAVADACGRALRRSLPTIAATSAIALVGAGAWASYRFITTSDRFAIRTIEIRGESHLTEEQVRAALPVQLGDNVFATNLDKLTRALRETPWIASATAHRVLPDTIVVEIREHAPAALVELGGLYLVDTSGHPFKRAQLEAGDGAGLPVITGLERSAYEQDPDATATLVTDALAVLEAWGQDPTRPAIGELHLDARHALTLRTYEHAIAIQLGPIDPLVPHGPQAHEAPRGSHATSTPGAGDELAARLRTFDAAWADLSDAERTRARAIHLDARPDQVAVALHPSLKD